MLPACCSRTLNCVYTQAMMDKAKNEIILATLEKHGGSTTFQVIMDVAEEHHCDVCSAALNSLKRKGKVEYEGMMLLLPVNADVVVSLPGSAPAAGAGGGDAPAPAPKAKWKPPPAPEPAPAPAPAPAAAAVAAVAGAPLKPENVEEGMTVRMVAAPEQTGTVIKRQGARVRVDFSGSGGPKSKWVVCGDLTSGDDAGGGDDDAAE